MHKAKDMHTQDMFELPEQPAAVPGSMDFRKEVSCLFGQIVDHYCSLSPDHDRYRLAADISRLTGVEITKAMIDGYTAESRKKFNVPFWLVVAAEEAANSRLLTNWLVKKRGGRVFYGKEIIQAEIGAQELKKRQANKKIKELEKRIEA